MDALFAFTDAQKEKELKLLIEKLSLDQIELSKEFEIIKKEVKEIFNNNSAIKEEFLKYLSGSTFPKFVTRLNTYLNYISRLMILLNFYMIMNYFFSPNPKNLS